MTAPTAPTAGTAPAKRRGRRRGFETSTDMLRSLGLVLLIVAALWFFGRSPSDEKPLRPVDQREDVAAWTSTVPGAPTVTAPAGWTATVAQFTPQPAGLRLGWNTSSRRYVEYAASTGPSAPFIDTVTGSGTQDGTVEVVGRTWQRWEDADGSLSLVRVVGPVTVVVGTTRENAPESEVLELAARVSG